MSVSNDISVSLTALIIMVRNVLGSKLLYTLSYQLQSAPPSFGSLDANGLVSRELVMRPGMRFYPGLSFWNGAQDLNSGERVYAIVHEYLEHGWDENNFKGFFGKYRICHVDAQLVGSLAKQQTKKAIL